MERIKGTDKATPGRIWKRLVPGGGELHHLGRPSADRLSPRGPRHVRPCWGLCSCPQGVGFGARHLARGQMQLSKTRGNPFPLSLSFRNRATTWPAAGALAGTVKELVRGVCECACVCVGGGLCMCWERGAQGYQHPWLSPLGTCGRCGGPCPPCPLLLQVSIQAEPRPRITDSAALSLGVQATATAKFPPQGPSRGLPACTEGKWGRSS